MINDQYIASPIFSETIINKSNAPIKHLGESTSIVKSPNLYEKRSATTNISYIPAVNSEDPNNSFGWAIDEKVNIMYNCEEIVSDSKESFVIPESLYEIKEYIMKIFYLSNLLTINSSKIHK